MAVSRTFSNWALKLHAKTAQSAAAVYVIGIRDQGINLNLASQIENADGSVYASFGYLSEGAPVGNIQTLDLKGFLDACGITGMLIDADGTHPGVVMYFQRNAQGGTREIAAASNHLSWTIANGLMVPKTVILPHRGAATLAADIIARKESTTDPVSVSAVADLPAGVNPTIDEVYGVGPVSLNGVEILGKRDVSIDFGIQVDVESGDGEVYPSFVTIRQIAPSITIQSVHADVVSTLTVDGAYYTASQVKVYARKKAEGGTFVADGTAAHILFTMGKCRIDPIDVGAGMINLKITPWATPGTVTPITINTAIAIT